VALERNIFKLAKADFLGTAMRMTIVNGEVVFSSGGA
jgi:predicted amidohydrolase YtcJ